jgi:hypothetical protein
VWGLSQLLLGLLYVVALWRYRALVPLLYLLLILEYAGRIAIGTWKPLPTLGTPPGAPGGVVLLGVAVLMLSLSLRPGRAAPLAAESGREAAPHGVV